MKINCKETGWITFSIVAALPYFARTPSQPRVWLGIRPVRQTGVSQVL